jgi:hypothetical protein
LHPMQQPGQIQPLSNILVFLVAVTVNKGSLP